MQIHYFQRYHSKENVDTANTMLLLSRLYSYSPNKFYAFLNDSILPENSDSELTFILQEKNKNSIPDAVISQKSFKIVVETKLYGQFNEKQLVNHLESIEENVDCKVLLSLAPKSMNKKIKDEFEATLKTYNKSLRRPITHCNITFESLIQGIRNVIDERDYELIDVIDDYEKYCFLQKLIPDEWKWMRAVTAGITFEINKKLNLYYDDADRGFTGHDYIGLYTQKSVRAIGKIKAVIVAYESENGLDYHCEKGKLTDEYKEKINEAIVDAKNHGFNLPNNRYFFVEKFYDTDYKKVTPYPIQRVKFMDLTKILDTTKLPETCEMASMLANMTWE